MYRSRTTDNLNMFGVMADDGRGVPAEGRNIKPESVILAGHY